MISAYAPGARWAETSLCEFPISKDQVNRAPKNTLACPLVSTHILTLSSALHALTDISVPNRHPYIYPHTHTHIHLCIVHP